MGRTRKKDFMVFITWISTKRLSQKMPHRPEVRRFAPQVRSVFHFCYAFLHYSCITKYFALFSARFMLCKLFAFGEKKAGFVKKVFIPKMPKLVNAAFRLQGFAMSILDYAFWHLFSKTKIQSPFFCTTRILQTFCVLVNKS